MLTRAEMKRNALASLKGNWGTAIGAVIMVYLISVVISMIPTVGTFLDIFTSGIFTFGLYSFFLNLVRTNNASFDKCFDGFRGNASKSIRTYILVWIFSALWTLLFIVPGIIAAIRYSQAFYILNDNPDMTASQVVEASKTMMRGRKMEYFILCLSFSGWAILSCVTVGIGFIWLVPYIHATMTRFYEGAKDKNEEVTTFA